MPTGIACGFPAMSTVVCGVHFVSLFASEMSFVNFERFPER